MLPSHPLTTAQAVVWLVVCLDYEIFTLDNYLHQLI